MKILVDMNLSPAWVPIFIREGWQTVHWRDIGAPNASDYDILNWARKNEYVVFTHDLDFGAILAASNADCPSVIQVRTQDVTPDHIKQPLIQILNEYRDLVLEGALISFDESRSRVRILPMRV